MAIFDTISEINYKSYESESKGTCYGEGASADVTYCASGCTNTPDSNARGDCKDLGFDWQGTEIDYEVSTLKDIDLTLITGFEGHTQYSGGTIDISRTDITFSDGSRMAIDTTLANWKVKMAQTF